MNHRDDQPTDGPRETEGAVDPSDVEDLPDGATPETPGYQASRQTLEQAEDESDQDSGHLRG